VGSPAVGRIVARSAADTWTPVVLELGGKDPFVVCEDADVDSIVQTACRGVWQNMGQVPSYYTCDTDSLVTWLLS
jgi:aldehyde dehydrogenase (NAD+)